LIRSKYREELTALYDLGKEFAKDHPAVASMLSGPTSDPDVERLLQGVAFMTAQLREKLDDEFPEIIHDFIRLIWPHYLRPLPCATIVAFKPDELLKNTATIEAGTELESRPVEGTPCQFRTCFDVAVQPLTITSVSATDNLDEQSITIEIALNDNTLKEWAPENMRLFLSGDYQRTIDLSQATNIYCLLRTCLNRIVLSTDDYSFSLSPDHLKPVGFDDNEDLIPYPSNSFPAYKIIQEYFLLTEKFLFVDITGMDHWNDKSDASCFEIRFELKDTPFPIPRVRTDDFVLSATPVINIFDHEAEPVRVDHKKDRYRICPTGNDTSHFQLYSVKEVVGFIHGTAEQRTYDPFEAFSVEAQKKPVYHTHLCPSANKSSYDIYLSVAYPDIPDLSPDKPQPPPLETLSIQLKCTNGNLPQSLHIGDISIRTENIPQEVNFINIRQTTIAVMPSLGTNLLWRLISHLSLNHSSFSKTENLKAILALYIFQTRGDHRATLINKNRINGIEKVESKPVDRLVSGILMRGQEIKIYANIEKYLSPGDLYLFGCIIDQFIALCASLNSFTRLIVEDISSGKSFHWPARLGNKFLL